MISPRSLKHIKKYHQSMFSISCLKRGEKTFPCFFTIQLSVFHSYRTPQSSLIPLQIKFYPLPLSIIPQNPQLVLSLLTIVSYCSFHFTPSFLKFLISCGHETPLTLLLRCSHATQYNLYYKLYSSVSSEKGFSKTN